MEHQWGTPVSATRRIYFIDSASRVSMRALAALAATVAAATVAAATVAAAALATASVTAATVTTAALATDNLGPNGSVLRARRARGDVQQRRARQRRLGGRVPGIL